MFVTGEAVTGTTSPPPEVIVLRDARTRRVRARTAPIRAGRLGGYTRDGRFLLVVTGKTSSVLLDARTLRHVETFPFGGVAAALSPVADQAAFGHADGSLGLADLRSKKVTALSGQATGSIEAVTFSPDGRSVATATDAGTVAVWDLRTRALRETFTGHSAAVRAATFSPDGRTLYTAGYDGSIIATDVSGTRRLGQPFRYTSSAGDISTSSDVSPDGGLFALSPGPNRVSFWHAGAPATPALALRGPVGNVSGLAFGRDGNLVAAVGSRNAVLWNLRTRKTVRILPVGEHGADGVAFGPDGHTLAIGRADGIDAVYDLRTGKETAKLKGKGSVVDIDFSPDGRLLASASLTGTVTLWSLARRSVVHELPGAVAAFAVRFSPNGKLVAVGDSSGAVVMWDPVTGKRVGQPLVGHSGGVGSLGFDPTGRTLVTSTDDGKLRLWDVATRKLIGAPLPGSTTGGSVHFFPDGKRILGVFNSGTGVIWNVDPAAWKAKACSVAGRNLTHAEWAEFLGRRSYRNVCP
jgi:WD40 repeat protein